MHTTEEPGAFASLENHAEPASAAPPFTERRIDPDNPPWGIGMAIVTWVASVALLAISSVAFLLSYAAKRGITPSLPNYNNLLIDFALKDRTAVFLQVLATVPAHLLTLLVIWAVVTRLGKRPFWETLGWSWGRTFNLWSSIAIGVILFFASSGLAKLLGSGTPTQLEQILNSSLASKYTIAFLATFTAPLVEEFIYRGVLYSGLRKVIGTVGAAIFIAALFTAVHVPQYKTDFGVIAAVGLLSISLTLIRAVSGKLLPCFIVHFVFNGIQSVLIVIGASGTQPTNAPEHATALIGTLTHSLTWLI